MDNRDTIYIISECITNPEETVPVILNESVVDTKDGHKIHTVTIDTCLQSFEVKNWNGRIYGKDLIMDSLDNDGMIQCDMAHGAWCGEISHPLETTPQRQVIFDPARCSHRILNYRCEGNLLKGNVQTLAGGYGDVMRDRILQGMPAAFSLRSLGSVDLETRRVKAPLKIITYDHVYRPSHREAYQETILSEATGIVTLDSLNESAVFVPINETMDQITGYIKEHSDNVAKVAEMFRLDKLDLILTENGRVNLKIDDDTVVNIPLESAINLQYNDILAKGAVRRR